MGKRGIREHIIATRALVGLPWPEAAKLFLGQEGRKIRAYQYVMLPWRPQWRAWDPTDEEHAEVIALLAAPLSHARHIERISAVMEKVAIRFNDAMHRYKKEDEDGIAVRRNAAAKAERRRLRKLPRQSA